MVKWPTSTIVSYRQESPVGVSEMSDIFMAYSPGAMPSSGMRMRSENVSPASTGNASVCVMAIGVAMLE